MSESIAFEAQEIVRGAAKPVEPGETIKGQLRKAARNLGYPSGSWRVRSGWYGEAECWSAKAFEDLKARYAKWCVKQERLAIIERSKLATVFGALASKLESSSDEEFYSEDIRALRMLASQLCTRDGKTE